MEPYIHFNPEEVTTFTAERPRICTIMTFAATFNLHIEHFDISSAFLDESFTQTKPFFIQQIPRFDGSYKHPCKGAKRLGNLYRTPLASFTYFSALAKFFKAFGSKHTASDLCLLYRRTAHVLSPSPSPSTMSL